MSSNTHQHPHDPLKESTVRDGRWGRGICVCKEHLQKQELSGAGLVNFIRNHFYDFTPISMSVTNFSHGLRACIVTMPMILKNEVFSDFLLSMLWRQQRHTLRKKAMSCGNELKPLQNCTGLLFSSEQAAETGVLLKPALASCHREIIPGSLKYEDKILTYWFFSWKRTINLMLGKNYQTTSIAVAKPPLIPYWITLFLAFYIVVLSNKLKKTLKLNLIKVSSTILICKENCDCFVVMEKHSAKYFVILQWLKQAGRLKPGVLRIANLERNKQVFLVDSQWPQNLLPPLLHWQVWHCRKLPVDNVSDICLCN